MAKITPEHLARGAFVYVRQSTADQVLNNHESRRRQYGLVERARALGWNTVEVIDDDLGRSGSGIARPGFEKLLAAICEGRVGAVVSIEASRLARNGRDWHTLLEFCGLVGTLILDEDGTYDPRHPNDRLLLGMKGTMSEMELSLFRQRSLEALKQKARRGELFLSVAVGYLKAPDDRIEKDPDRRVQEAIALVFSKFDELQTVRQVHLWMRQKRLPLPAVSHGQDGRNISWKLPVYNTVHHMLTNRADRRRLMIWADCGRLGLMCCVVAMTFSIPAASVPSSNRTELVAALAVVAFLLGTAAVVRGNAAQTLLPSIVGRENLERANGQMWSAEQALGRFVGPPLAGALIAAGIVMPFAFNSVTLALVIGIVWLIALPVRRPTEHKRFWPALLEGLGWMRRNPAILRLAIMLGAINAVSVGGLTILVLYAQEVLHLSAAGYGILLACGAAGGVLGGIVAPDIVRRIGMRASLMVALVAFILLHLLLGLFSSATLAGLAMFVEAAGGMLWNVVTVSYRQRMIPDELLGRVNSVYRFFGQGTTPFGAVGAGALVSLLQPAIGRSAALHGPYLLGAVVCGSLLAYGLMRLRFEQDSS